MTLAALKGKRVHFIGIGGAGMSGLARIALSHGFDVSGCDEKDSSVISALRALGATCHGEHRADHVLGSDLVVFSSAISTTNLELNRARELNIPILTRAGALAILMSESKAIAVAGTHGKTTTSSMLAVAIQSCGLDPSFAIGGTVISSGSNAHRGTGEFFVVEADESDGSFIEYHPFAAIITNIEHDHVDYFKSEDSVFQAFESFAKTINPDGFLTYCLDDPGAVRLVTSLDAIPTLSYGVNAQADLVIDQINLLPMGSTARALWHGKSVGVIDLQVPGKHNLLNASAALATGINLGLSPTELLTGLGIFRGTGRRFELKGTVHGIRVIDDYGHHPTEIEVTLEAARRYAGDGRVLVIFQPHRYSRTVAFLNQFAQTLDVADEVVLLEIYGASEKPIAGISSKLICEAMSHGRYIPNFIEATDYIINIANPGDLIMTLGAGDVSSLAPIIVDGLSKKYSN